MDATQGTRPAGAGWMTGLRRLAAGAGVVHGVLCGAWPLAAGATDEVVRERVESPYFFVKSDDPTLDQLPLKSTRVDVKIAGVIADVTVTQRYRNEGKRAIEARYVFPGGTRSAVYAMNVRLGDRLLTAKIREKEAARVEYQAAKSEGRTAALLEQHRPNVFEMNVANILPGDDVAVELHYTELVVPRDGTYRFVYPTVVGPRYQSASAAVKETYVRAPFGRAGEASQTAFEMHVALASPIGVKDVVSTTHVLDVKRPLERNAAGGSDRVDIALAKDAKPGNDRDFVMDYRLAGDAIESGVLLHEAKGNGDGENFFLAMIEPPKKVGGTAIVPREYVFVIDISGSMHGYPLDTAKALLRKLIGGLRPSDTFNVLLFSGDNSMLAPQSLPATGPNIAFAIQTIDRQRGGGSTELIPALRRTFAMPKDSDRSRTVVVITDGYVSVEREAFELVRRHLGDTNLFAFGIGSSVNRHLIEGLARAGQGEPFVVLREDAAADEAERFRKMIEAPVLTHIRARFEGAEGFKAYDIEPEAIGDLFSSRPVIVFGKWKGKPAGKLVVEGLTANGNYRASVALGGDVHGNEHPALRYLWARRRIETLSDQEGLEGRGSGAQAITDLGLKYNLLTQYTSFIAVDSVVRNSTGQVTPVDQPSPLPAGVSELAVGAEVPATPEPPLVAMLAVSLGMVGGIAAWKRRASRGSGSAR